MNMPVSRSTGPLLQVLQNCTSRAPSCRGLGFTDQSGPIQWDEAATAGLELVQKIATMFDLHLIAQ